MISDENNGVVSESWKHPPIAMKKASSRYNIEDHYGARVVPAANMKNQN